MKINFYKEIVGDSINVMLSAATYNFKRMMTKWKSSFLKRKNIFHSIIISKITLMFCFIFTAMFLPETSNGSIKIF